MAYSRRAGPLRSIREWGTVGAGGDDSMLVAQACADLRGTGAAIHVPSDCRLLMGPAARLAGRTPTLDSVGLISDGVRDGGEGGIYGTRGGTILLTDTGGPAFIAKRNWTLRGLTFFWPAQIEDAQAPRVFPPLLAGVGALAGGPNEVTQWRFIDNDVVNAWHLIDLSGDISGGFQMRGNRIFTLDAALILGWMPVESFVSDNQFSPNAFGVSAKLRDYAATQGTIIKVVGNGTATVRAAHSVDALMLSNNATFGFGFGIRVAGGCLNTSAVTGCYWDGVGSVLSVESGGLIAGLTITGGNWFTGIYGNSATVTTAVSVATDSTLGSDLTITGVNAEFTTGAIVDWRGASGSLRISGMHAPYVQSSGAAPSNPAIHFASASGFLSIEGSNLIAYGTATGPAISVEQSATMLLTGNRFARWAAPISVTASAITATITGNISSGTTGSAAYIGSAAIYLPSVGNAWDKPVPAWDVTTRITDNAQTFSFGGTVQAALLPNGTLRTAGAVVASTTP